MTIQNNAGTTTAGTAVPRQLVFTADSGSAMGDTWQFLAQQLSTAAAVASTLAVFAKASEESGSIVIIDQRLGCLPILMGNDGNPVPLYEFVEVIDEIVDYGQLQTEFPTLSFGQIVGAVAFLRKLVQFNSKNLDIDVLEDELIEGDERFKATIVKTLADREVTSVRTAEQRNGG